MPTRARAMSRRALRVADLGHGRTGLAVVDVEVGCLFGRGPVVHVLQLGTDGGSATGASQPVVEALAGDALVGEAAHDVHGGLRGALGGQARGLLAELDLGLTDVAAEQ